jgi:hypothetical protein
VVVVVAVGVEIEVADRHTVPCLVHIALAGVVAVAVVQLETPVMTDMHTVPCWVHIALLVVVADVAVHEVETGATETAATNGIHIVRCSVHTALALALALVQADVHPHKHSHIADSSAACNRQGVRR